MRILNNQAYSRVASDFNPTLKADGSPVPYNPMKKALMLKKSSASKLVLYNASLSIERFYFNESLSKYPSAAFHFEIVYSPYQWLRISRCGFKVQDEVVHSVVGSNLLFEHSVVDVAVMQNFVSILRNDNCTYYR